VKSVTEKLWRQSVNRERNDEMWRLTSAKYGIIVANGQYKYQRNENSSLNNESINILAEKNEN
jgi:hypothetical protein